MEVERRPRLIELQLCIPREALVQQVLNFSPPFTQAIGPPLEYIVNILRSSSYVSESYELVWLPYIM